MDSATRRLVRTRARNRCEYCGLAQVDSPLAVLHIEHVIPRKHGGGDEAENLALACVDCNLSKGPNLTGIDPESGQIAPLFNPRKQAWGDHFAWLGLVIVGLTPAGRATVAVLRLNSDDRLALRSASA